MVRCYNVVPRPVDGPGKGDKRGGSPRGQADDISALGTAVLYKLFEIAPKLTGKVEWSSDLCGG